MNDRGDFKNKMQHDIVNQIDLLDSKWESKLEEMYVAQVENGKSYTNNEKWFIRRWTINKLKMWINKQT